MREKKISDSVKKDITTIWVCSPTKEVLDEKKNFIEDELKRNITYDELLRFILKSLDNSKFLKYVEKTKDLFSIEKSMEAKK